jgi:hypothetical protein
VVKFLSKGKTVLDNNTSVDIEVLEALPEKPRRRGGKRVGAGRPALVRENNERIAQGLAPIPLKPPKPRKYKSNAVLPVSKKARSQEILAEMLGKKSKYVVQKVLDKALDDNDEDQMACLKLVMDRVLPADYLAKAKSNGNSININITGVGETVIEAEEYVQDAEFEEVDDEL